MYPFCSKNVFKNALGMLILTVDGKKCAMKKYMNYTISRFVQHFLIDAFKIVHEDLHLTRKYWAVEKEQT